MHNFSQWRIPRYSLLSRSSSLEDESTTGFLQDGDAEHEWLKEGHLQPTPRPLYRRHSTAIIVHAALALCNIMLLVGTFLWPKGNYVPNAVPSKWLASNRAQKALMLPRQRHFKKRSAIDSTSSAMTPDWRTTALSSLTTTVSVDRRHLSSKPRGMNCFSVRVPCSL